MFLQTKKLTFGYIKKPLLFAGVDLTMDGGVLFVTGMSGAGKSTFLKTLCDMQDMYLGEVLVGGKRPRENTKNITYLPDKPIFIENKSVLDNLKFAANTIGKEFDENMVGSYFKDKLKVKVRKLSKLDRYLLALKRAEIKNAKLFLLDLCFDDLMTDEVEIYVKELKALFSDNSRLFIVAISADDYKLFNYLNSNAEFLHIFMGKTYKFDNFDQFTAKITDSSMADYTNFVKYGAEVISNENGYYLQLEGRTLKLEEKYIKGILSYFEVSSSAKVNLYSIEDLLDFSEKQLFEKLDDKSVLMFDDVSYEILP